MRSRSYQNFSSIKPLLPELLSKNTQNWAQFGPAPQKVRGIRKAKSRAGNTQNLKLVDPQTMEECGR